MKIIDLVFTAILLATTTYAQGSWTIAAEQNVVCIHTFVLPNNKIMCVERPHNSDAGPYPINAKTNGEVAAITDLNSGQSANTRAVNNPFCAGHSQMANGDIMIIGGDYPVGTNAEGTEILASGILSRRMYRPCPSNNPGCTPEWIFDGVMTTGRWYPTITTLADGEIMIVSGSLKNLDFDNLADTNNPTYEYYPSRTGTWPRRLDILDETFPFNLYPLVIQLHYGNIMLFSSNRTAIIDPTTDTVTETIPLANFPDHNPWIYPHTPTAVVLPLTAANNYQTAVLMCGGSNLNRDADPRCIKIDFAEASPSWKLSAPMQTGRIIPNSLLLPDGTVFMSNGIANGLAGGSPGTANFGFGPILASEIYNPTTDTWTAMAPMTIGRLYHSGSVLLADGRVLITGSEMQNYKDLEDGLTNCFPTTRNIAAPCTDPFEYSMEAFEPPYLSLDVERPVIESSTLSTTYGSTFFLKLSTNALSIKTVNAVRYSTSTHSTNPDQRFVELKLLRKNSTYLQVQAPANGNIAPPGNWFVFALRDGKPSIAATINFQQGELQSVEEPVGGIDGDANASISLKASLLGVLSVLTLLL